MYEKEIEAILNSIDDLMSTKVRYYTEHQREEIKKDVKKALEDFATAILKTSGVIIKK